VVSRSLDRIAADHGCRFTLAVAQAPYCAPSRQSFFTGRRPAVTSVHTFSHADARAFVPLSPAHAAGRPTWTALPHAFAAANYSTYGVGITIEDFRHSATRCPGCWTDGYYLGWPDGDVDPGTIDATVASASVAWLRGRAERAERARPFFLMAGFHGGHKPWPYDPAVHRSHGVGGYTLEAADLRRWRKPEGAGQHTSPSRELSRK
jgi:arylsulfatase A-like enzyme